MMARMTATTAGVVPAPQLLVLMVDGSRIGCRAVSRVNGAR
jgi:hypothetical protein